MERRYERKKRLRRQSDGRKRENITKWRMLERHRHGENGMAKPGSERLTLATGKME
jgi:hypothetical protein